MKFLYHSVVSFFLASLFVNADELLTSADYEVLRENAIPYNKVLRRRLEGNQSLYYGTEENLLNYPQQKYGNLQFEDDGYQRFQISSNDKIKFRSCVAVETENYNLLHDNLVDYTKKGVLTSIRNYVLFDVCSSDNDCSHDDDTFVVDLLTFIQATLNYGPAEREKTCEACEKYQDTCANNDARLLEEIVETNCTYVLFDTDTCDKCNEYNCWGNDEEINLYDLEQWVTEYTDCSKLDSQWNSFDLYASWMCNEKGTGIELGLFIDEYCTMHQKYLDTSNHLQNESGYLEQSQDVLGMMFDATIHCQDDDWYYLDYDSYIELMQGEDNCRAVEDDISEACGELFYSAFVPRKISNCGTPQNAAEVMYADGGDDFDAYNQARQSISGRNTKWYTYDISADYVFDGATTCEIVYLKYKRDSSIFRSFYKKSIQRWLALIAGMLVGAGAGLLAAVLFAKSRKTSSPSKDVLLDDYNASINAILKKLPKRTINLALINKQKDESDLDDNKQRISSPRSKMIKDSLSKVKKVIRSKLMNRGEADKEEALVTNDEVVIIDKTGEDDTILHYG